MRLQKPVFVSISTNFPVPYKCSHHVHPPVSPSSPTRRSPLRRQQPFRPSRLLSLRSRVPDASDSSFLPTQFLSERLCRVGRAVSITSSACLGRARMRSSASPSVPIPMVVIVQGIAAIVFASTRARFELRHRSAPVLQSADGSVAHFEQASGGDQDGLRS